MKIATSKDSKFYYLDPGTKYNRKTHTLCLSIPGKRFWTGKEPKNGHPPKVWAVEVSAMTTQFLTMAFPDADWDGQRQQDMQTDFLLTDPFKKVSEKITGFKPKTKPLGPYQAKGFMGSRAFKSFALFMEQRTGKTWVTLNTAAYLYEQGLIDALVIITLKGVCSTWEEEIEKHWPATRLPASVHRFRSSHTQQFLDFVAAEVDGLPILIVNVEGLAHERIANLILDFYEGFKSVFTAVDESTSIKNPTAKRTKTVFKIGNMSVYKRILTGTPITQDVRDLFAQFFFLDPKIIGFNSFYFFENHFTEKQGYEILFFKHLDQLQAAVTPYIYRVLRKDVFKHLPEEVRQTFTVDLTPKMLKVYNDIETKLLAEFQGKEIRTPLAINRILRLSQVIGGFFPYEEEKSTKYLAIEPDNKNPKIQMMLDILEGESKTAKAVMWARFRSEIEMIVRVLKKKYGVDSVREIHGGIREAQRTKNRHAFQDPESPVRFLVNQLDTGGIGIDLDQAELMIYFSNSYRLESRLQSEARPMSAKQRKAVGIYDIVAEGTVDELVLLALKTKKSFADILDKENFESWLRME